MPKKINKLALFITINLFILPLVYAANEIKIGAVFPMSGGQATYGQESTNGIKLALKKLQGTKIKGKELKLIIEDNKSEPIEAANAVRKLIEVDKVDIVVGDVASSNTLAAAPIAQKAGVPMITPASTNEKVTEVGDYISRICFTDNFQGLVMAKFAFHSLKKKKAAVIVDASSDYSKGLAQVFKQKYKEFGGTLIAEEYSYQQKDTDFRSLLKKVKRENPDVVFVPGYYTEVGLMLRQAHQMGFKVPFLGGDGWDSPKLQELAGPEAIGGNYISSHFSPDDKDPAVQKFVSDYQVEYKAVPGAMAALGYDLVFVVADAFKRSKDLSHNAVKMAINGTSGLSLITGKISLDQKRNAVKSAVILETREHGMFFKEKVAP